MCVRGTPARHSAVAGRQPKDSSMNKQGAYLPLPLSLFASARTCSASTNHTCSHAHALSLPHSLSSLGLAQVESMLSSCAADHGHHAMHACQWPTPHHTDSPCLSPHPFFVLWCGRRDARQLHVWVWWWCVAQPAASLTLHPVRVGAHICVLIFLEAHGCPSLFFFSPPHHVEERESKAEGSRAAMQSRAEQAGGQAAR